MNWNAIGSGSKAAVLFILILTHTQGKTTKWQLQIVASNKRNTIMLGFNHLTLCMEMPNYNTV